MIVTLDELDAAAAPVARQMDPTPQYDWPQLSARCAITFIDWLRRTHPGCRGNIDSSVLQTVLSSDTARGLGLENAAFPC